MRPPLGWFGILRLSLVQASLGAIVVLTTSTINRIMVVELALPAVLPGALVTLHYALQVLRPRFGHQSDGGRRRTPWMVGGMCALAAGGFGAAVATAWLSTNLVGGILLAIAAFSLIGIGVGSAGTSLLALLAERVPAERRAAAAMATWMMMILGIVVTAVTVGHLLDPYSPEKLIRVAALVGAAAVVVTIIAVWGVEGRSTVRREHSAAVEVPFREALARTWQEPEARRFTVFVFVSMIAYSAQDLILEPFAGIAFGLAPGQSTTLSGLQHAGVFVGMATAGLLGSGRLGRSLLSLRGWTVLGCIASAVALLGLVRAAAVGPGWPIGPSVFALGTANGIFAVAAIGSMMMLAAEGKDSQEGVRVGLWGAAQAIGFAVGGFLGTVLVGVFEAVLGEAIPAYAAVFALEAGLFLIAGLLAKRLADTRSASTRRNLRIQGRTEARAA